MSTFSNWFFRATRFEREQQIVVRALIAGAAFLSYLEDRDDIVWRFLKNDGVQTRLIERGLFLAATCLIGIGAYFCKMSRSTAPVESAARIPAASSQYFVGQFLYSMGLASLVPLAGLCILVAGEAVRLFRLWLARDEIPNRQATPSGSTTPSETLTRTQLSFAQAARRETLKWALFITMIVFTITLRDRYADILICASILASILLNWRFVRNCWIGREA